MVLAVKSSRKEVAALQECERHFTRALSLFLSDHPHVKRFIIAHSGGLDSQVLLYLVARYFSDISLLVLHINHNLQEQSAVWADFSLGQSRNLSLSHQTVDVFPANHSENAAREARYSAFEKVVESGDCILMGHHADDQAETVLYRMLRGTGLAGMSGITPDRRLGKGYLFRPLLNLSRSDLEGVARECGLAFIDDPSNTDERYDRNYLRHQIVPALKKRWPNMLERWQKNIQIVSESNQLLESYLDGDLLELVDVTRNCLDINSLLKIEGLKRSALLRHWLYKKTDTRVNQNQLDTIYSDVLQAQRDANPIYSIGRYELRRFMKQLYIVEPHSDECDYEDHETHLEGIGEYRLSGGVLTINRESTGLKVSAGLVVKYRQGGERCRPLGKSHSISLKKLFQEAAVPTWLRGSWPLLFAGEELVAVPGICICEGWYSEKSGFSLLWRPF